MRPRTGTLAPTAWAKEIASVEEHGGRGDHVMANVARLQKLDGLHGHGFKHEAADAGHGFHVLFHLVGQVIKNQGARAISGKGPAVGIGGQVLALRVAKANLDSLKVRRQQKCSSGAHVHSLVFIARALPSLFWRGSGTVWLLPLLTKG